MSPDAQAGDFVWLDPAEAQFVHSCREALKMERQAYAAADAERKALWARVRVLEGQLSARLRVEADGAPMEP